jgi:uncharacterized cupredoxin-like copper-binding protein
MIKVDRSLHTIIAALCGAVSLVLGIDGASADSMVNMDDTHDHGPVAGYSFGAPGAPADVDRTVRIVMGDMSFDPAMVTITAGETIRFVVINRSGIDHDFTIGDPIAQGAHRAEMVEMMDNPGMTHADDPNAVLVKAGETRELIWWFAPTGGLEFDCNVPGHYEAGMRGTIDVLGEFGTR